MSFLLAPLNIWRPGYRDEPREPSQAEMAAPENELKGPRRTAQRLSMSQRLEIAEASRTLTQRRVATRFGCSMSTVKNCRDAAGLSRRKNTRDQKRVIAAEQGEAYLVARHHGISESSVRVYRKRVEKGEL